jgi:hypothetical protein
MDVLEEKQNGAPPMEIDEVVSVRDRKLLPVLFMCILQVVVIASGRRSFLGQAHARPRARREGF